MTATEINFKLVDQITKLLADADCTVKEALEILRYASNVITASSKVQESELQLQNTK